MPQWVSTAVYLLVILSVLVIAHEWGHFIVARLFKMRVEEFSLFFGPKVLRLGKRGDTEYNVRAVPLGGFVRIAGMDPDDVSGGRPVLEAIRHPRFAEPEGVDDVVHQLRTDSLADIDPDKVSGQVRAAVQQAAGAGGRLTEEGRASLEQLAHSPRITQDEHKLISMVLNAHARAEDPGLYSQRPIYQRALVIFAGPAASILFGYLVFCLMGMTVGMPGNHATNMVQVMPGRPAARAGLQSGDRIVAIDGKPTRDGKDLTRIIHASIGKKLRLTIDRSGKELGIEATPEPQMLPAEVGGKTVMQRKGVIGVLPLPRMERLGLKDSLVQGTLQTQFRLVTLVQTLFRPKALKEDVGGPIAMYQMTSVSQKLGAAFIISLGASISLGLGIMNLLPIPVLDGGHLVLLAVEKLRRRRLSPREVYRAQMVGLSVLVLIMVFVFYNDIMRTISGRALQ